MKKVRRHSKANEFRVKERGLNSCWRDVKPQDGTNAMEFNRFWFRVYYRNSMSLSYSRRIDIASSENLKPVDTGGDTNQMIDGPILPEDYRNTKFSDIINTVET